MESYLEILKNDPAPMLCLILTIAVIYIFKLWRITFRKVVPKMYLNSKSEQNFYTQFLYHCPKNMMVNCKVRLADVCEINGKHNWKLFSKLSQKHVDFVVCDKNTSKVMFVIELDDRSHLGSNAQRRDKEKEYFLRRAGIELYRIKASKNYTNQIRKIVDKCSYPQHKNKMKTGSTNSCPKCNHELETISMSFPNKGMAFKLCNKCNFRTEPVKGL